MTSIKHRQKELTIILCIRDPRWSDESLKVLDSYKKLVGEFSKNVNLKLVEITENFVSMGKRFLDEECANPQDIGAADIVRNGYENYMKNLRFRIDAHFVIFFRKCFGREASKYYELVRVNDIEAEFKKNSKFENMMRFIIQKCCNIRNERNIREKFEFQDCDMIRVLIEAEKNKNLSKESVVKEIFIQALYDPIMHYPNIEGFTRIMESYYKISKKIQDISENIVLYVNKESTTETNYLNLRAENEKKINDAIKEEKLSESIIEELHGYLKFLSAKSYIETLKLNAKNPEKITYQVLMFFIKYGSYQDIINLQLKEHSKRKLIYKCSPYFDGNFQEILYALYKNHIYLFQSIYEIYKEVIKKSCEVNFQYKEVVDGEIDGLKEKFNFRNLFQFLDSLEIEYNHEDVKKVVKTLKQVHIKKLMLAKNRFQQFERDMFKRHILIDKKILFNSIPALYIPEKVFPSLCGLFISFLDCDKKEYILSYLARLSAVNNSVLGWTVFGKTKIISNSWAISFAFGKSSTKWVGYKKYKQEGYEITNMVSFCDLDNGKIIDFKSYISNDNKIHEKQHKFEHLKIDPLTACIKASFYVVQMGGYKT